MDEGYQAFRVGLDGPLTRIEVIDDEESGQKVVFWEDIEFHFPGIHCVMNGDIAITFARDSKRRRIKPFCIKYNPGIVLDVILSNSAVQRTLSQHSPSSSVNSLAIHPPYNDGSGDNTLSRSFNNLSVNSLMPCDDPWQQQYDNPLTRSPSSITRSSSYTSRAPSSVSRTLNTSREPNSTIIPISDYAEIASTDPLAPKIQSTLQVSAQLFGHFEQSIKNGQMNQAESIKQEIWAGFANLQTEMAKNKELHTQMLELQHRVLQMQKEALDRLAVIQSRVQAVLTQTYELHEYPIPRLFIVLPRETQRRDMIVSPFSSRFKLYFLCECGDHTKQQPPPQYQQQHQRFARSAASQDHHSLSSWGSGSTTSVDSSISSHDGSGSRMMTHHIHLAKHEGYELDRPNEFFQKYGGHILTLLQMLKYGVMIAGIVLPPLAHLKLAEGIEKAQNGLDFPESGLEPKVDYAIQYLQDITSNPGSSADSSPARGMVGTEAIDQRLYQGRAKYQSQESTHELEALEGADLRLLSTFLKIKDEGKVLGNLYRTVTNEGHVKWVCLDHYRENYRDSAVKQFQDAIAINNGTFERNTGKVSVRLSSSIIAKQFYESLEGAKFIQELSLILDWETTLDDLRSLQDTIRKSNVTILKLDFCNTQSPSWDLFNRTRRYDPVLQMMANARLQAFYLTRCDGFWSRLTKSVASTATSMPSAILLRILSVQGTVENWKVDQQRMEDLLKHCPRLTDLRLQCCDIDATFELVKNATSGFQILQTLELTVSQGNRQEQVSITIAQPRGEISSVTIITNKRPYTQLVYSGQVRKLVLCNEFNLAAEGPVLERIIQQNQRLHELGIRCPISDLSLAFEFIWARAAYSKSLRLVKIHDIDGRNKISSTDLKDPKTTLLELLSSESAGREGILRAFGWSLKKIPPGMQFNVELLNGLEESMRTKGSALQRLHVNISMLDEESLDLLARVIQLSQATLTKLDINVYASQSNHRELAMTALARFIVRVSSQITRLQLHMYGLSLFLFGLSSAASAAQAASTSLSRTFTVSGRGNAGDVTFPVVSRPTLLNVVTMPNLRELDIQPEADTYGKMLHCQINPPHVQWLQIPLLSPSLKTIKLGYLDFLKDDWIMLLQSIKFETVETLILHGTNFSDGQVGQILECLNNSTQNQLYYTGNRTISLKTLMIEGSLMTGPVLSSLVAQLRTIIPDCEVHV